MKRKSLRKISTRNMVGILSARRTRWLEASLNNGTFNATHFLRFGGRKIFDCGIDSEEVSWDIESFLAFYSQAYWRIDQIV